MKKISILILLFLLAGCGTEMKKPTGGLTPPMKEVEFADLQNWRNSDQRAAFTAFNISCAKINILPANFDMKFAGKAGDWKIPCARAKSVPAGNLAAVRQFFESNFTPYQIFAQQPYRGSVEQGLITGYHEIMLAGSLRKSPQFPIPLHRKPADPALQGLSRTEITRGALDGKGLEVAYVRDKIDRAFLQIQGSGKLQLEDGSIIDVGFDGKNGRPYTALGKVLEQQEGVAGHLINAEYIKSWLRANPQRVDAVLNKNESYIYFQRKENLISRDIPLSAQASGPIGGQGVGLTPEASIAVDKEVYPYGIPFWLETRNPKTSAPYHRLFIAQDTGTAIKGVIRADIFFGSTAYAQEMASLMKEAGKAVILLPKR